MIKISVIIPTYNTSKYIEECLKSIVETKYENLEVIIIDDSSTDDTCKIINSFTHQYKYIKIYNIKHQGVAFARNVGIKKATGDYLVFVDSDDYIIYNIFDEINKIDKDIDCFVINYEKRVNGVNVNKYDILNKTNSKKDMLEQLYSKRSILPVWRFVVKRELANNIIFTNGIVFEDEEWSAKMLLKCNSFYVIEDIVYSYQKREGSILSGLNLFSYKDLISVCERLLKLSEKYIGFEKDFLLRRVYLNMEYCYYSIRKLSKPREPLWIKRLAKKDKKH